MTDSDPIIAEIDRANDAPHPGRFIPVHLSDAPKVADLLMAAKVGRFALEAALDLAAQGGRTEDVETLQVTLSESDAAIRAIEPGWTP